MELPERYLINVNIEGDDVQLEVPNIDTAYLLLNDSEAAADFVKGLQQKSSQSSTASTSGQSSMFMSQPLTDVECIWTKKRPTNKDLEATALLLSLRDKWKLKFDDRKTIKSKLWTEIALTLENQGFHLGKNGHERCRQKFANLLKAYLAYIKHQKTTGSAGDQETPPFFTEMHSIVGSKDKVNPQHLEDSFAESNEEIDESAVDVEHESNKENVCEPSANKNTGVRSRDRFRSVRRTVKPTSLSESILHELQEDRHCRENQMTFMKQHLEKAEEQRERFLDIIKKALLPKRKRDDSDSD